MAGLGAEADEDCYCNGLDRLVSACANRSGRNNRCRRPYGSLRYVAPISCVCLTARHSVPCFLLSATGVKLAHVMDSDLDEPLSDTSDMDCRSQTVVRVNIVSTNSTNSSQRSLNCFWATTGVKPARSTPRCGRRSGRTAYQHE